MLNLIDKINKQIQLQKKLPNLIRELEVFFEPICKLLLIQIHFTSCIQVIKSVVFQTVDK